MRGVLVPIIFVFFLSIFLVIGTAMIEPVGEEVKTWVDDDYDSTIDTVYDTYFMWIPVVFMGGAIYFGVRWYTSRERFSGGRPPL